MDLHQYPSPLHTVLCLDGLPGSIATARNHARAFLAQIPLRESEHTAASDVLVLVSELVTNAVRHAPGPCSLGLVYDGSSLVIAISDTGPELPRRRPGDLLTGSGGFGWNVLTSLTKDIHIARHGADGKTIVAVLPFPQA
ncbi:ATP-binding protein [Kitasatospora sp. NBC_01287]|uniref:ATP-binding protein n=1 Tax=Kitasatospora sp. NBC_01287 TaxID=2903573 RepID=UPI0022538692|nr:ATP-binding protein [Kitasatospora sp. NBC_01287]MCX4744637.1 ATP-binding protein [Kitasatospora sp. NBC_01287]